MLVSLLILAFVAAHIVRDGYPSYKVLLAGLLGTTLEPLYHLSTQWARLSGAILCSVGALAITEPFTAALIGAGMLAGFYTDQKHGEAAGVDTVTAVLDAFASGISSLVPVTAVLLWVVGPTALWLVAVGLLKPAIWWLAWQALRSVQDTWFQPTRCAAGVFGGAIAVGLYLLVA